MAEIELSARLDRHHTCWVKATISLIPDEATLLCINGPSLSSCVHGLAYLIYSTFIFSSVVSETYLIMGASQTIHIHKEWPEMDL